MNTIQIIEQIYTKLAEEISHGVIPVSLRLPSLVGTVQDDPFDSWVGDKISRFLPDVEVAHAGKLGTARQSYGHGLSGEVRWPRV